MEVSLVFSVVNIVTGSIWARIIWGIWWTWDYRLTSALVCILIFFGYLVMRRAIDEPTQRARLSSALCIFGCVDVVIVWKSIEWFRNQHPGPVLDFRTGGGKWIRRIRMFFGLNFRRDPADGDRAGADPHPAGSHRARDRFIAPAGAHGRIERKDLGTIMDARNFTFMFYGFLAAWVIVLLYVIAWRGAGPASRKNWMR